MSSLSKFVSALLRKWWFLSVAILSLGSTGATYVPSLQPYLGTQRWIPLTALAVSWLIATYQVYADLDGELGSCRAQLGAVPVRKSDLQIHDEGSIFYRLKEISSPSVYGTWWRFHIAVENRGSRSAVINRYDLRVREFAKAYCEQKPAYKSSITTPTSSVGLPQNFLAANGYINVDAEKATAVGYLDFFLPEVPPDGVHLLHCTLTLVDTNGEQSSCTFEVKEYQHS
jgi:hypothetical protein